MLAVGSLVLLAAALAAPQVTSPTSATAVAPHKAQFAALQEQVVQARAELARAAFEQQLYREASYQAERVLSVQPDHAVRDIPAKVKAMSGEAVAAGYQDALRSRGPHYRRDVNKALRPIANDMVKLAAECDKAGDADLAEHVLLAAYSVDPDSDKAAQGLRKLDYDVVFNYGVIPKADKIEARKMLQGLGGGFLGRRGLEDELEFWSDAWGLQTRHYRFVTNADHRTVFAFAQACEDLFAAWHEFMRESGLKLRKLSKPCSIYFFDSKTSYEIILRVRGSDPSDSESALGFYAPANQIGYFYGDRSFYGDNLTRLFETFYHEGGHQLFDLALKSPWRGDLAKHELHWVEEGFCCYLESLVVTGEGRDRTYQFGTVMDDDLAAGVELCESGRLRSLGEFAHQPSAAWNAYGAGYPHATLLVHFLLHAREGAWRRPAFQLLFEETTQGGLKKKDLFETLRVTPEALDAELKEYAASLDALTKREYQ
jgi:hypothetical protein